MKIFLVYGAIGSTTHFLHEEHARKYAQKTGSDWKEIDVMETIPNFHSDINMFGELDENGKWSVSKETNQVLYQPNPIDHFTCNVDESGGGNCTYRHGYVSVNGGDDQKVQEKFDELTCKVEKMIEARDG